MPCRPLARAVARSRRRFSTLPKLKPAPTNPTVHLLETTAAFVPQALADEPRQLKLWDGILSTLITDMRSPYPRPVRLVVCGSDTSGARELVTALLEEPFTSDPQQAQSLRERWAAAPPEQTSCTIEYGSPAADSDGSLRLPLAYLDQFPIPVQVIEGADPALLQTADVPVLVSPLEELHALNITRPDLIVAVNIDRTDSQPRASTSRSTVAPAKYLYVSPSQALRALEVLRESPGSPEAVQRYQTAFIASRVPTVTQTLHAILASLENTDKLRNRTALAQLDRIAASVSDLDSRVEEERCQGEPRGLWLPGGSLLLTAALTDATSVLEYKVNHMRWWRTVWAIDEITTHITQTVQRVWCVGLEKQLTFHSGRLQRMQHDFTERAFALLVPSNTRALYSPVLHNALRQLTAAPAFPVGPSTLVDPLMARSTQIVEAPTARMHVVGQRALVGMGGASAAGMAISWTGWVGALMNADGVLGFPVLEPATAMATGVLISLLGVSWATWAWNRARKQWLEDVMRVSGGLKQDITEVLDHTMEDRVLVAARTACTELSKRLGERKSELDRLQDQLDTLSAAVEKFEQRK
ncbi:hypothetical protein B0H11DRAFT_2245830 [Mycena galericulata]|nr:hypothetical protein B0H11DRAFT_2245830 [Mycena galericulata]